MSEDIRFAAVRYSTRPRAEDLAVLDAYERAALGSARHAAERAAGFLAVRTAAQRVSGVAAHRFAVRRREHARPVLLCDGVAVGWQLSLAHAGGLAVAAVATAGGGR